MNVFWPGIGKASDVDDSIFKPFTFKIQFSQFMLHHCMNNVF